MKVAHSKEMKVLSIRHAPSDGGISDKGHDESKCSGSPFPDAI